MKEKLGKCLKAFKTFMQDVSMGHKSGSIILVRSNAKTVVGGSQIWTIVGFMWYLFRLKFVILPKFKTKHKCGSHKFVTVVFMFRPKFELNHKLKTKHKYDMNPTNEIVKFLPMRGGGG